VSQPATGLENGFKENVGFFYLKNP